MDIAIQSAVALKRCPFCGISPVMTSMFELFMVRCPNCEAEGGMGGTEESAAAAWNRRTPEQPE